jgi:hypothetical protein
MNFGCTIYKPVSIILQQYCYKKSKLILQNSGGINLRYKLHGHRHWIYVFEGLVSARQDADLEKQSLSLNLHRPSDMTAQSS